MVMTLQAGGIPAEFAISRRSFADERMFEPVQLHVFCSRVDVKAWTPTSGLVLHRSKAGE